MLAVGQRAPPVPGHVGPSVATCFIRGSGGGAAGKTDATVECDAATEPHPAVFVLSLGKARPTQLTGGDYVETGIVAPRGVCLPLRSRC